MKKCPCAHLGNCPLWATFPPGEEGKAALEELLTRTDLDGNRLFKPIPGVELGCGVPITDALSGDVNEASEHLPASRVLSRGGFIIRDSNGNAYLLLAAADPERTFNYGAALAQFRCRAKNYMWRRLHPNIADQEVN